MRGQWKEATRVVIERGCEEWKEASRGVERAKSASFHSSPGNLIGLERLQVRRGRERQGEAAGGPRKEAVASFQPHSHAHFPLVAI